MILMIDNYDSFTYNIVQELASLGAEIEVVKNDEIDVAGIAAKKPSAIILSPGPGNPDSAGVTLEAIRAFAGKIPLFGVCLGHQAIAQAFGGKVVPAKKLMHGKTSFIHHDGKGVFAGMRQDFEAMRYHSLAVERESLPDCLEVSAVSEDGEIMGLRHKTLPVEGVQYHPESIGTPDGICQLRNFLGLGNRQASEAEAGAYRTFRTILEGRMEERELVLLLTSNRDKEVTAEELAGAARAMREAGLRIDLDGCPAVDIVGTGGDGFGTFNVSTTAAFVAAGAGVTVAKHGNVASTSKCGSADVLAALGYDLDLPTEKVRESILKNGIGFLYAKRMHPAMRFAAPVRKRLGFRTIFNLLGPLTNPAGVRRHVVGAYDPKLTPVMAEALRLLGSVRAQVISAENGLDEIAPGGITFVSDLKDGDVTSSLLDAGKAYGASHPLSAIGGGDAKENAELLTAVLSGKDRGGRRAAAIENAAAAILVAGRAKDFLEAMDFARESIDSGRALEKMKLMVSFR
jgi:anthranilate synthase/phosphoribosyltransferase